MAKESKEHEMRLAPFNVSPPTSDLWAVIDKIGQFAFGPFVPGIPTRTTRY